MWKEIVVDDWKHFIDISSLFESKGWIFRGQCSSEWGLETSLFRECKKLDMKLNNETLLSVERKMIREFNSSYKLYTHHTIPPLGDITTSTSDDILEWKLNTLSTMQHYGSPTRLLDWTYSLYLATFFALDGASNNFCVYALNMNELSKRHHVFGEQKRRIFQKSESPEIFLFSFEPYEKNERIRKQQGLFLVPSIIEKKIDDILNIYGIEEGKFHGEDVAFKIIFNGENIMEWWYKLKQMNITHESIYPGLEGFCKSLKLNILDV